MSSQQDTSARGVALVTGGTGAVGPVLVQNLLEQGYQVHVLARHAPPPGTLPPATQIIEGDILDGDTLKRILNGVDVVFHLAAKLHINNPGAELNREYRRVNVEGTKKVIDAAQAGGVRRVVFFSTISVYGASKPGVVWSEKSPINPASIYASSKAEAEQIVLAAKQQDSEQPLGVVLRVAAVYGKRIKGNYARLVTALQKGRFVPVGSGKNRRTLIYEQDVARGAILVAEHPAAAGRLYNLTDGSVHTFSEIEGAICRALKIKTPRFYVPAQPVRLAATALGAGFSVIGRTAPVDATTIDKLLEDIAVSGALLQRDLGFQPQYDLQSGWSACLGEF